MMFRSSSIIRSEKSHRKICPVSMRMMSPSIRAGRVADDRFSDHDRAVCLQNLQRPDSPLVIARYFEENFSARSGAEQNVVLLKQGGIVRNEIYGFRSFQLESDPPSRGRPRRRSTNGSSSAFSKTIRSSRLPETVVPDFKANPIEGGCHVLEGFYLNVQAELDFQTALARSGFFELHLVIRRHRHEDLRK